VETVFCWPLTANFKGEKMSEDKQKPIEEMITKESCACPTETQPEQGGETGRRGGESVPDDQETERGMDIYTEDIEA
jgi:hypothetical protein